MKKMIAAFFAFILLTTTAGAVDIYVDTEKVSTDTPPTIVDGRTLVPVRAIFEAIGASVEWDASTRTATGVRSDTTVSIQIDNTTAYVNGEPYILDVPAQLINNRTMVPARFISEAMGCDVTWHQSTQTVGVSDKTKGHQIYVTATGKHYHYDATCNGGTYYEATLAEAMGRHLSPCDKCIQKDSPLYTEGVPAAKYKTTVLRVVDGDTIVVNYMGAEEKVRLIGVDTPESVHPDNTQNTDAGFAASEFTTVYLTDAEVELEFDVQQRDQYGRLLAYVYVGGEMFNETLLRTGYANVATYSPNTKYADRFAEIVRKRDPSIPSGEYYDGYMKAPTVIYSSSADENGMEGAFLYEEGIITDAQVIAEGEYVLLETTNGHVAIMNTLYLSDFSVFKVGNYVRIGFIYLMNLDYTNTPAGIYVENLTKVNNPNIPDWLINDKPTSGNWGNTQEPAKEPDNSGYYDTDTVYVSNRSNTIHRVHNCGGMKNYRTMNRDDADAKGYKYCPNCW